MKYNVNILGNRGERHLKKSVVLLKLFCKYKLIKI